MIGASGHESRMLWLPMMKTLSVLNSRARSNRLDKVFERICRLSDSCRHQRRRKLPGAADACIAGEHQDVVLPLIIALSMIMLDVFAQGAPQPVSYTS
jgi:hypothetical protein